MQRPDGSCGGFGIPIHDFDLKSTGEKDGAAGLERAVNQHRTIGWIFDDFQQASDRVFIALVFRGEMYVREASAFQRRSHGFYGRCVFSRPQIDHRSDAMSIRNFKQFFRRYLFGLIELIRREGRETMFEKRPLRIVADACKKGNSDAKCDPAGELVNSQVNQSLEQHGASLWQA